MSPPAVAALVLSAALLVAPSYRGVARRRLRVPRSAGTRPSLYLLPCALAAGAVVLAPVTVVAAAALLALTVSARVRRRQRRRRADREAHALEGALDVLIGELRVGAHPVPAFGVAAAETAGVVGAALHAVAARAQLGADVAAGLSIVAAGSALPAHWNRLAVTWRLGADAGLPMTALMRMAQRDIVERQQFSARVDAGMAGARATSAILAALPVLGVLLGELMGAAPLRLLFGGGAGGYLLLIGIALVCCGLWWSDRITDRLPV